jgi:hypothetical protein
VILSGCIRSPHPTHRRKALRRGAISFDRTARKVRLPADADRRGFTGLAFTRIYRLRQLLLASRHLRVAADAVERAGAGSVMSQLRRARARSTPGHRDDFAH